MKWVKATARKNLWHKWFAWHLVRRREFQGGWFFTTTWWLQTIERRLENGYGPGWEYRDPVRSKHLVPDPEYSSDVAARESQA